MASGSGGKEGGSTGRSREREGEKPAGHVLALPAAVFPDVVCHEQAAAVPRKARSCVPRAAPSAWCSYTTPVLPPPPPEKEARARRPSRVRVAPSPGAAAAVETPAKRARWCVHCGAAETPQWRQGPSGRRTLCNACGIVYRATGALQEHRTPEAPRVAPAAGSRPESPIWEPEASPPESPVWKPGVSPSPAIYLVRKPAKLRKNPRNVPTAPPPPPPPPAPAPAHRAKKGKKKKKKSSLRWGSSKSTQWREYPRPPWEESAPAPGKTKGRACVHCGSMRTPQWREGPTGRGTLCNACGVRYRQGRLLPEYRPIASPTFTPSEHANTHRQVLKLHRLRQCNDAPPQPPPPAAAAVHGEHPADAASCAAGGGAGGWADEPGALCSLDSLLFDGPSAPPIVDGDDFFT